MSRGVPGPLAMLGRKPCAAVLKWPLLLRQVPVWAQTRWPHPLRGPPFPGAISLGTGGLGLLDWTCIFLPRDRLGNRQDVTITSLAPAQAAQCIHLPCSGLSRVSWERPLFHECDAHSVGVVLILLTRAAALADFQSARLKTACASLCLLCLHYVPACCPGAEGSIPHMQSTVGLPVSISCPGTRPSQCCTPQVLLELPQGLWTRGPLELEETHDVSPQAPLGAQP